MTDLKRTRRPLNTKDYLLYSNEIKIYITEDNVWQNDQSLLKQEEPKEKDNLIAVAQEKSRSFYTGFLKNTAYKNIIVLSGAGSSREGAKKRKEVTEPGEDRKGLWKATETILGKPLFDALRMEIKYDNGSDLEDLLSKTYMYQRFKPDCIIKYEVKSEDEQEGNKQEKKTLSDVIDLIQKSIVEECDLDIDGQLHLRFLNRIINRNLKLPRIKFFTTNYDTLIEQAAQEAGVTLIDGFSFTMPRRFSGANFDFDIVYRDKSRIKNEESFVPKVLHLYKMHGSLDWTTDEKGNIIVDSTSKSDDKKRLIIYPASNKYESSYEQPYFEMMSRFQSYLRQENTLLIVIGFSLYDKHISNVIYEAVTQNPNFTLLICNYYKCPDCESISIPIDSDENLKRFKDLENVYIINEKFSDFVENYPSNQVYSNLNPESNGNKSV
jgi:hypothetical protein